MRNASHLTLSRHRIWYFRWPLGSHYSPSLPARHIKISLGTRCPREALRIARQLSQIAETIVAQGINDGMRFDEIRAALKQHFITLIEKQKAHISEHGRLSIWDRKIWESSSQVAQHAIETDDKGFPNVSDDATINKVIAHLKLPILPGSGPYEVFRGEFLRAYRAYALAVLDYDTSLDSVDYSSKEIVLPAPTVAPIKSSTPSLKLKDLWDPFVKEKTLGNLWKPGTLIEKQKHFDVLSEILGESADAAHLTRSDARKVKEALLSRPRNRNKNPLVRDLALAEASSLEGIDKLSIKSVNMHLTTYSSLYEWAVNNSFAQENLFEGMALSQKTTKGDKRDPFSSTQVKTILSELLDNSRGLVTKDFQKWGSLIALYSGARLNEIAQIHLADLREENGVLCFDLNDDDEGKSLKNENSRRLVPVHSKLVEYGLKDYANALRAIGETRLFPTLKESGKNGYGRSLGRWFNDRFLVKLGFKSKTIVFHSTRHTVITQLMQKDVPEAVVKAIVGHAQAGVTQQHYFKQGYTLGQLQIALEQLKYEV